MGKLVIEGNKVYSVDESCMKRKNLTLAQIRQMEGSRQSQNSSTKEKKGK